MCILYISIPQPPNCPSLLPHSLSSLSALLVGREMAVLVSCLEQPGVLRKPGKSNVGVQAALLYKKHRRLPTVLPRRRTEREGWDDSDSAWLPRVRGQSRESLPPSLPCPISHHDWQCQCRVRGPVSRRTRSLWLDFLRSKAQDHFFFSICPPQLAFPIPSNSPSLRHAGHTCQPPVKARWGSSWGTCHHRSALQGSLTSLLPTSILGLASSGEKLATVEV